MRLDRLLDAGQVVFPPADMKMGRDARLGDAVRHCQARHGKGFFERLRAVVYAGKQVAVEVDHARTSN